MNSSELTEIADEISLDKSFTESLCRFIDNNPDTVLFLYKEEDGIKRKLFEDTDTYNLFLKENFSRDLHPLLNLYFAVVFAGLCKIEYQIKDIDSDIYKETMSDINIWARTYQKVTGMAGLENIGWIRRHLMCDIFRLGRLQFEMSSLDRKIKDYPEGTPCLNIHIPEGGKLDIQRCRRSIDKAKSFFTRHHSRNYQIAVCHSWLLHESLGGILNQNSNIIRFAELFEIIESDDDQAQALDRVFGRDANISEALPELTSLQRGVKRFLLDGGQPGMGYGIIEL